LLIATASTKRLGVGMAVAYHQNKDLIEANGIEVFSSNYVLYGDMSRRVMDTLRAIAGEENVEVYSVDEAFINLKHIPPDQLAAIAKDIKETVEIWTGIQVSVGVAPTKTLSKLANALAKKDKDRTKCVMLLDTREKITQALQSVHIKELWGVGRQLAEKLTSLGIDTPWKLCSNMNEEWVRKNLGGVVGVRLLKELKGEEAITMDEPLENKKMIATTRMFGSPVTNLTDIKEAIATYTSRAAEKLRRQYSAASVINIFIVPKEKNNGAVFRHGPMVSAYTILPSATSITNELIKPAMTLVDRIYEKGRAYKKAGVMLSGLVPDSSVQANLFAPPEKNSHRLLMSTVDNINFAMRDDTLKFASSGVAKNWKMRQELRSARFSTRWEELREVK
jgi:DNA polymerase V